MANLNVTCTLAQGTSSDQALSGAAPATSGSAGAGGATGATTSSEPLGKPPAQGPGMGLFLPIILVMVFFVVMTTITSRRDKKRQQQMMDSLKRGDQVLTIGGIVGTIAEVRDDHVMLRLDESSNTKVKLVRTAIQRNLSAAAGNVSKDDGVSGSGSGSTQVEVRAKGESSKEKAGV